jgi:hypothetical protein
MKKEHGCPENKFAMEKLEFADDLPAFSLKERSF